VVFRLPFSDEPLHSTTMSLAVDQLELGPIGTNTYLVRASATADEAVVVDPSGSATTILRALDAVGARCVAILVTHGHFDHIVSLADLAGLSEAPVYAPAGERVLLEEPGAFTPPGITVPAATADVWLDGGETIDVAGISFAVTPVPGHSPAHVAYFAEGELFSGDVLFAGSVGRTDLPGGDWDALAASIGSLLDAYPATTVVHPGHGPETTLAAELKSNPFLASLRATRAAE
jgi:glyoxylase-like metal-dependent hydrolase (beta-lactamase superfamily II)